MNKILIINCCPVKDGATAYIVDKISDTLKRDFIIRTECIDDYNINYCLGCRSCHQSGMCVQEDDTTALLAQLEWADKIVLVSPSYWADVPGQFKVFIDRCTPWSNTHEPHASLPDGKRGYAVVLRTGPNMKECNRLIDTISHFCGHMQIAFCGSLGLCSVSSKEDAIGKTEEIVSFCRIISQ